MPTVLLITLFVVGVLAIPTLMFGIAAGNAGWHRPIWHPTLRVWRRLTGQKPDPAHVRGRGVASVLTQAEPEEPEKPTPGPGSPSDENPVDEPTPVSVLHLAVYDPAEHIPTLPAAAPSQGGFGAGDTGQFAAITAEYEPPELVEREARASTEQDGSGWVMNTGQFHTWFWRERDQQQRQAADDGEPGTGDVLVGAR